MNCDLKRVPAVSDAPGALPAERAADVAALLALRARAAAAARLHVAPAALADSADWRLEHGEIRHRSDRFFSIGAVRYEDADGRQREQPVILQPEIGTLGFLLHRSARGAEVLVNAKVEPGNVDTCQLAPSCQATLSNQERVHGGDATPCYAWFLDPAPQRVLVDHLHSEQGTRFLYKRNRDVIVELDDAERARLALHPTHAWAPLRGLLDLLLHDFAVNTDARSVLVSADWAALVQGEPFASGAARSPIGRPLHRSFHDASEVDAEVKDVLDRLRAARRRARLQTEQIPIEALAGWALAPDGLRATDGGAMDVRQYQVHVQHREVERWDQPFVQSRGVGEVALCVADMGGVPKLLFRLSTEFGLHHGTELTPALAVEPGGQTEPGSWEARLAAHIEDEGTVWMTCRQSEEGGRFFRDQNRYRIVWLARPPRDLPASAVWLSLGAVHQLAQQEATFTNEGRSAISLLLAYL